jgi:CheY-like chemotaxis protein
MLPVDSGTASGGALVPIPRILIVDDEPMILELLKMAFEGQAWHIDVVTLGEMGLRRHRETPYDLLLLDKNLPDLDGVALVRELRRQKDPVKVVMMTGFGSAASAAETLNLGVIAYLEKPFKRIADVTATVEMALARTGGPGSGLAAYHLDLDEPEPEAPPPPPAGPPEGKPRCTLVIGASDPRERALLATITGVAPQHICYAAQPDELLATLAVEDPILLVLAGALASPGVVARVRAQAPEVACAVVAADLGLPAAMELIRLQTTAVITEPLDSAAARGRLAHVVRQVAVRALRPAARG